MALQPLERGEHRLNVGLLTVSQRQGIVHLFEFTIEREYHVSLLVLVRDRLLRRRRSTGDTLLLLHLDQVLLREQVERDLSIARRVLSGI